MDQNENQIRVGLYIGQGAPPPNVKADMAVDMIGKQIGVYAVRVAGTLATLLGTP